jgi:hypothetical protein
MRSEPKEGQRPNQGKENAGRHRPHNRIRYNRSGSTAALQTSRDRSRSWTNGRLSLTGIWSMRTPMSDDFAVRCTGCEFTWNTPAMADGLRILGSCPKCKGELEFRDTAEVTIAALPADPAAAPHMVLGIPRI